MSLLGIALALILTTVAAGCTGTDAGSTTCSEFAEMGSNTGLDASFTAEQQETIRDLMSEAGAVAGQENQAGLQIIAYCNIYGGRAGSNQDEPISNIPGLQDAG